MNKNQKIAAGIAAGVVAVGAAIWGYIKYRKNKKNAENLEEVASAETVKEEPEVTPETKEE